MFKTFRDALRVKEIRDRLLLTLVMLVIIRIGSAIPVPFISRDVLAQVYNDSNSALGLLNTFSGGAFEKMTIFALSISPYITSSIIIQLLAIAIPKLEEMSKDGETGRKKMEKITRYGSIVLALIESVAMCIGYINSAITTTGNNKFLVIATIALSFTAGSAFLMWLGERITEKGVGNGISMILLFGIVASFPADIRAIGVKYFGTGHKFVSQLIAAVVTVLVIIIMVVATVYLQDGTRRIAVQYAKKVQGRKMVGGQSSFIPIKVNTAGVIPVIFSMSLMSFPQIITGFFGSGIGNLGSFSAATTWQKVLCFLSSGCWFRFENGFGICTLGVLLYIALNIFFAYFYTAITFNPNETANNLKTNSGFIPGIRPGRPTADYLTKVLNYIIFIGAIGLTIVALLPIVISGVCGLSLSFGGTSIIIVVGVILETMQQVESMMVVRHYRGFLSE